jgi:iron complex outermembrane receptor protein
MTGNVCARRRQPIARVAGVVALGLVALGAPVGGVAQAPGGSVAGRVADERGAPVPGADVGIVGSTLGARTATSGTYVIENVPAGAHTVRARLIGYRSQTASVRVTAGQRVAQNFTLAADPLNLEAVVVTGTAAPRINLEASNATTILGAAEITRAAPRSTTEALRYVPGFTRVESSGGEVNENISMRGILGVEYVMFMEDGLPVFPTMHTFFMNADNLFRYDENLERLEVVRGGSSALFGSNTPGAIINYINKTGGPDIAGSMKVSGATEGLARYDFNLNGPFGQDWRFNVGGFYRYDHGVRDPGFPGVAGGQFKGSVTRQLDNGYLRFSAKVINDRNQFILPLPFQNPSDPQYVPGFSDYGSMNTLEGNNLRVPTPPGELELPLDHGLRTKASWFTADLGFDFAQGWSVRNSAQIMNNEQEWNAILPFNIMSSVDAVQDYVGSYFGSYYKDALQQRGVLPAAATVDSVKSSALPGTVYGLTFTNHLDGLGNPVPFNTPNDLLAPGGEWHVEKPISAFQNQLQIKKSLPGGHNASLGLYFANYTQTNRWFFTDILTDVRDNPRFVDLVVNSATIRYVSYLTAGGTNTTDVPVSNIQGTKNGFRRFLSNYVNGSGTTTVFSGVLGGEFKLAPRLRADVGFRYEFNDFVQTAERTSNVGVSDTVSETFYDVEPWGNGSFRQLDRSLDDWAASIGVNYSVNDELSVYALGSRAYKMPALDEFLVASAQAQVQLFEPRRTNSVEGGVKYASRRFGVTVNGFWTRLKNIVGQGAVVDPVTGATVWEIRTSPENRSYGVEVEVSAQAIEGLTLLANGTVLKAELGTGAGADIGSWINGVPPVIGNVAATYAIGNLSLLGDLHYVGRRFSADEEAGVPRNRLPAYAYANFGASLQIPGQAITIAADLANAFQSNGLEEGNPRVAGPAGTLFLARPLLPRRFTASVRYQF